MSNDSLMGDLAREFVNGDGGDIVDVITFIEAPWGLNQKLTPPQVVMLKCFYGLPLDNTKKYVKVMDVMNEKLLDTLTEREFLDYLYNEGRCNKKHTDGKKFRRLILNIGRRGSKTSMASFVSNYELYKLMKTGDVVKHYKLSAGSQAYILNVAPTTEQAESLFGMIQSQTSSCNYLSDRIFHSTMSYFDLMTDADMKKNIRGKTSVVSIAGGCSSQALRGKNAIVIVLDEVAFFLENAGRFSGEEVFKALEPSLNSFGADGKMILISSPYAKYGLFYDKCMDSWEDKDDFTLMFNLYSSLANPDNIDPVLLRNAKRADRSGFQTEYAAEFSDSVKAWIEDEDEFLVNVDKNFYLPSRGQQGIKYYMGVDLGFKNDGASIAVVHKEPNGKIVLDYADVFFSKSSDIWEVEKSIYHDCRKYSDKEVLMMEDIVDEIKERDRWFPVSKGCFDQSSGYALAERLNVANMGKVEMVNFTDALNAKVYALVKRLYCENLLLLSDHPILVPELLVLEASLKSKGKVIVEAPRRKGLHDDISDAYARAVWLCYSDNTEARQNVATGTGRRSVSAIGNRTAASRMKAHGGNPRGSLPLGMKRKKFR